MFRLRLCIFAFLTAFQMVHARTSSIAGHDSIDDNRSHVGLYFRPTLSYNAGTQFVPKYYDPADCSCHYSYDKISEFANAGFSFGLEVQTKKYWQRVSIVTGMTLEAFRYSGTADEHAFSYLTVPPTTYNNGEINYSFDDYFLSAPLMIQSQLFLKHFRGLHAHVGIAGAYAMILTSSKSSGLEYRWHNSANYSEFSAFSIGGLDYYIGRKPIVSLGVEGKIQLDTTPHGRRLTSAGIKIGILL